MPFLSNTVMICDCFALLIDINVMYNKRARKISILKLFLFPLFEYIYSTRKIPNL